MTRRIGRPALVAAAAILCASALAFAHDPKKKSGASSEMMQGCEEHHSAAMKASEQVKMHLAEAKNAGTLAEMRRHVEMAQSAMADMEKHMSMCTEVMDKTHNGMMGTMTGPEKAAVKVVDPVCNMEVADTKTAPTLAYKGKTYYFCSEGDKDKFQKNPDQYAH